MCAFFCRLFALLFGRSVVLFVSSPQPYVSYGLLLYKASVPNQHFLLFSPLRSPRFAMVSALISSFPPFSIRNGRWEQMSADK